MKNVNLNINSLTPEKPRTEIIKTPKGYEIQINQQLICHNDNNEVGKCSNDYLSSHWDISKKKHGYFIKSKYKKFLLVGKMCMAFQVGRAIMQDCDDNNVNQIWTINKLYSKEKHRKKKSKKDSIKNLNMEIRNFDDERQNIVTNDIKKVIFEKINHNILENLDDKDIKKNKEILKNCDNNNIENPNTLDLEKECDQENTLNQLNDIVNQIVKLDSSIKNMTNLSNLNYLDVEKTSPNKLTGNIENKMNYTDDVILKVQQN
ncbi:hypothetical protein GVAV_003342 [Gurleya vavrai]